LVIIDPHAGDAPTGIRDSKDLSAAARSGLLDGIGAWVLAAAVGHAAATEIDEHGIVAALRLAGHRAWTQALSRLPDPHSQADVHAILLDGSHDWFTPQVLDALVQPPGEDICEVTAPVTTRVKADRDCAGVGAASVLAKVERDGIMDELHADHPAFGWGKNKGYGTAEHRQAIAELGPTQLHRRSWNLGTPA
jgi:ribonuclease HII